MDTGQGLKQEGLLRKKLKRATKDCDWFAIMAASEVFTGNLKDFFLPLCHDTRGNSSRVYLVLFISRWAC